LNQAVVWRNSATDHNNSSLWLTAADIRRKQSQISLTLAASLYQELCGSPLHEITELYACSWLCSLSYYIHKLSRTTL